MMLKKTLKLVTWGGFDLINMKFFTKIMKSRYAVMSVSLVISDFDILLLSAFSVFYTGFKKTIFQTFKLTNCISSSSLAANGNT